MDRHKIAWSQKGVPEGLKGQSDYRTKETNKFEINETAVSFREKTKLGSKVRRLHICDFLRTGPKTYTGK